MAGQIQAQLEMDLVDSAVIRYNVGTRRGETIQDLRFRGPFGSFERLTYRNPICRLFGVRLALPRWNEIDNGR